MIETSHPCACWLVLGLLAVVGIVADVQRVGKDDARIAR